MDSTERTGQAPTALDKADFFARCEAMGLENARISHEFKVSSQTIRNWRKKPDGELMPAWVSLACLAVESVRAGRLDGDLIEPISVAGLSQWQARHGFKTYNDTANVFSIKRQAVHNWYKRQRFPKWLPLACVGYDLLVQSNRGKNSVAAS